EHADRRGVPAVERAAQGVVAGAEFDARHVGKAHDLAVSAGFEHDIAELLGRLQAALRIDRDKEIAAALDRFGPKLAGRDLDVLIPYRADHVARGQAARGDLVRIDPNAHRVIAAAEHSYLADATQAREFVLDLDVDVVTQVERIVAAVRRVRRDHDGKGRGLLLRGHAERDHFR